MNMENLQQRNILISDFVEARSLEINRLHTILEKKIILSSKQSFQQLPKHMRRRAMSHNRYRVPSRIRQFYDKEKDKQSTKKDDTNRQKTNKDSTDKKFTRISICRKHIRKPKFLACKYSKRSQKKKWLETHLWNAKRMKMIEYFGYKIASNPNDKSHRSCFKFTKTDCSIFDSSYHQILSLKLPSVEIQKLQKQLSDHLDFTTSKAIADFFNQNSYLSGNRKLSNILFYRSTSRKELIGPVDLFWRPRSLEDSETAEMWMTFHPGCQAEIQSVFEEMYKEGFEFKIFKGGFNIFKIFGPLALEKFSLLLEQLGFNIEENHKIFEDNNLVKYFPLIGDSKLYPSDSLFYLNFKSAVKQKIVSQPKTHNRFHIQSECFNYEQSQKTNSAIMAIATYKYDSKPVGNFTWSPCIDNENPDSIKFKTLVRGRLTHRKLKSSVRNDSKINQTLGDPVKKEKHTPKNILPIIIDKGGNESEKLMSIEELGTFIGPADEMNVIINPEKNKINEIHSDCNKRPKTKGCADSASREKYLNLIISLDNTRKFSSSITIILPEGWGTYIWRSLHYLSCKAIGLREMEFMLHEAIDRVFPNDFPLTKSYDLYQAERFQKKVMSYFNKPPAKRVNHERIGFPFPFHANWHFLFSRRSIKDCSSEHIKSINISILKRGSIKENAIICLPLKEDLEKLAGLEEKDTKGFSVHTEPLKMKKWSEKMKNCEKKAYLSALQDIDISREVIGFVSSGQYSYTKSKYIGKAQIISCLELFLRPQHEILLLLRNPNSRFYYFVAAKAD